MKKKLLLLCFVCIFVLTGCAGAKYKEECLKEAKDMYSKINDSSIVSCVVEYSEEKKGTLYEFCITEDKTLYEGVRKVAKDDKYYDTTLKAYEQILDETKNHVEGYYTYEFLAKDLK